MLFYCSGKLKGLEIGMEETETHEINLDTLSAFPSNKITYTVLYVSKFDQKKRC